MLRICFCSFIEEQGHGIAGLDVIDDDDFHFAGGGVAGRDGNISFGLSGLNGVLVRRKILLGESFHLLGVVLVFSETEPLAETKVCITPCFREGLLSQCHVLSAKERHYRHWHSTPTRHFTSQVPRLGFQQSS